MPSHGHVFRKFCLSLVKLSAYAHRCRHTGTLHRLWPTTTSCPFLVLFLSGFLARDGPFSGCSMRPASGLPSTAPGRIHTSQNPTTRTTKGPTADATAPWNLYCLHSTAFIAPPMQFRGAAQSAGGAVYTTITSESSPPIPQARGCVHTDLELGRWI